MPGFDLSALVSGHASIRVDPSLFTARPGRGGRFCHSPSLDTSAPRLVGVTSRGNRSWLDQNLKTDQIMAHFPDHCDNLTFLPPLPSTILPLPLSTTLACSNPPNTLSNTLPSRPQKDMAMVQRALSLIPDRPGQKGSIIPEAKATVNDPSRPAHRPVAVTPPLVPGGTFRRLSEVMRRGEDLERIPSSEEKVSAATAT